MKEIEIMATYKSNGRLHVIVKHCMRITIPVQKSIRIPHSEIFKVKQTMRKIFAHELDESEKLLLIIFD